MNSVFNGKITEVDAVQGGLHLELPDDSGTSVGRGAVAARPAHAASAGVTPMPPQLLGPGVHRRRSASTSRADTGSRTPRWSTTRPTRAAQDLVDGKIVGWFQGRMEFGQRALGNRSILLDPRRKDGKDVVNAAIKFREAFRPFAPAILAERVADWFECPPGTQVPFMERVLMFRQEKRELVPAVVHVDGIGTAADGRRAHVAPLPRADRGVREAHRGSDRAQHELQPQRRADRLLAGRRASAPSTPARSTCSTSATFGSQMNSRRASVRNNSTTPTPAR